MGYAIGIVNGKVKENIGTLWRSAFIFGASMIFTVGSRYKLQCSDTSNTYKHIPLVHYETIKDFIDHIPYVWDPICIEQKEGSIELNIFKHPRSAVYILGAEDNGLPESILEKYKTVSIPTNRCLNVAVAGSIVMYDRMIKSNSPQMEGVAR